MLLVLSFLFLRKAGGDPMGEGGRDPVGDETYRFRLPRFKRFQTLFARSILVKIESPGHNFLDQLYVFSVFFDLFCLFFGVFANQKTLHEQINDRIQVSLSGNLFLLSGLTRYEK